MAGRRDCAGRRSRDRPGSQAVDNELGALARHYLADGAPHGMVGPAEGAAGVSTEVGGQDRPGGGLRGQVHQGVVRGGGLRVKGVYGDPAQTAWRTAWLSTRAPRAVLTRMAPGLTWARSSPLTIWVVRSLTAQWRERMSHWAASSSRGR